MRFRHNVMHVNSLSAFECIKGGVNQNCKDVYFVRLVGMNDTLVSDLEKMDYDMTVRMQSGRGIYQRVQKLPAPGNPQEAAEYEKCYQEWLEQGKKKALAKVLRDQEEYSSLLGTGIRKVTELYAANRAVSASMEKNFVVKLLFWHDFLLQDVLSLWSGNLSVKLVLANISRQQEYLFAYFLTLLGYDVLLVQSEQDIAEKEESLGHSQKIQIGDFRKTALPEYHREKILAAVNANVSAVRSDKSAASSVSHPVSIVHPGRSRGVSTGSVPSGQSAAATGGAAPPVGSGQRREASHPVSIVHPGRSRRASAGSVPSGQCAAATRGSVPPVGSGQRREASRPVSIAHPSRSAAPHTSAGNAAAEKSFEQLAQLASSVVMIAIHDKKGDIIGTGSGIMIGAGGYILTNNHVASGGRFYSIRIEDDDTVYSTDEVIKYHSVLDLAVLRVDRRLNPLPVYRGKNPLARGQKVVAIGSPLGLFNSVSDGIISGFRKIDGVDMIQFTAPISHGSSGGAVLNMYGEVIGISTAGIDAGQNINLAMGYECINQFIAGFV